MRCLSCNVSLTDYESTRKSAVTGEYLDLCNSCFSSISGEIGTIDREDLAHDEDMQSHCGEDAYEPIDTDDDL